MTVAGLASVALGIAVPVGVLRLPVCLVSSGQGLVWRPAAVAGWVTGSVGDAAGRGAGASCCVAGTAPGVLWMPPASVR